ncbi:magnesium and cobalt transport protein CorA [Advenella sp. WQ 585]|uniref:Magnesium and cobalt transport protein CorA n=1 Tax=Advenella mandrilli TaxID=2800330 RepID=A0ABS1EDG8_9BURK|nr:magnesium and cobalt transport protein CorA [Advenella mandrilli]MBK1779742.1 magnesium and cobalt transport protein CorA [Advenella mandrilli]
MTTKEKLNNAENPTETESKKEDTVAKPAKSGVVASVEYVHGRRRGTLSIEQIAGYRKEPTRLLWVGLKDPSKTELQHICGQLSLSADATEEIIKKHGRPKVIDYGEYIQIVAMTVSKENNRKPVFGEIQIIFGIGFLMTVRRGAAVSNTLLRERLEGCPDLIARGSDYVAAEILDVLADSYTDLTARLEYEVEQAEHQMLLEGLKENDIRKLYKQRRDLLRIHTAISPIIEICRKLSLVRIDVVEMDSRSNFSIVSDRVARLVEQINSLREALAFSFEASMMIGQNHQTDITKKLASWAAILAVPTAIAGIYGMNFRLMPELEWALGYPFVLALMFGVCGFLFWRFKKSGWL